MNSKTNNLALGLKIVLYSVVVVLGIIGWFGNKAGLTLGVGYALIILALVTVLIFSIMALIDEPKKSLRALLGIAGIIIIFLITYSSASDATTSKILVSATYVKFVGGALTMLYIVGGIAVVSIIASEIYSIFK